MNDEPTIVGTNALAEEFGVTRKTISAWRREGMPQIRRGKWDLDACREWVSEVRDTPELERQASHDDLRAAKLRVYIAQAERHEVQNARLFGQLVHVDTAQGTYAEAMSEAIGAGDTWVSQARNAEEKELRRGLWYELRQRIADSIRGVASTLASGEDVGPADLRKPRSVGG